MITSLSFISPGQPWPPEDADEAARLAEHARNEAIYNNLHEKVFAKYAAYLADHTGGDDKKIPVVLGWGEKATTSYINLVLAEPPDVELEGEDYNVERPDEEVLIDVSRDGIGLYEISQDGIGCINPKYVYLVTDPGNMRRVVAYVCHSTFMVDKTEHVKFTIHLPGKIQHLIYSIKNGKLDEKKELKDFEAFKALKVNGEGYQNTGVNEPLIVRVDNALSSDRRYGRSDYTPSVASLIEALELAFARREEVLAKFSRPVFVGPESSFNRFNFSKNRWEINLDEPLMVEPGSADAKYLTWQAELGAVEKGIEDKMDQLLYMLDLSRVLLAGKDSGGVASGAALTVRLIPSLARARRYASAMKAAIPKVLSLDAKLKAALGKGGAPVFDPSAIQITFKDGIPRDPLQDAQACSLAVAGGFMSIQKAISITQGLELVGEAMEAELARIRSQGEPGLGNVPANEPEPGMEPTEGGNGE